MPAPRIALATCASLPSWEHDDRPFHDALRHAGAQLEHPVWDDPAVDWSSFDACLIRTTWDYVPKIDAFTRWVEEVGARTRLWNPAPVVLWNVHKSYLHDLQRLGVPVTPTAWLSRGTRVDVAELCATRGWQRAFAKPMVGATSKGTLRFDATAAALPAAQRHVDALLAAGDAMVQPYLDSVEREGEYSLIVVDGQVTHGVRKIPPPGDYRVQDDFGATDEPWDAGDAERELALRIVRTAEQHCGVDAPLLLARVDFLRDAAGELLLNELELVEPSLFFRHAPAAGEALARALLARCS